VSTVILFPIDHSLYIFKALGFIHNPPITKISDPFKYMQILKYKNQYFYINLFVFMIIKISLLGLTKQTGID